MRPTTHSFQQGVQLGVGKEVVQKWIWDYSWDQHEAWLWSLAKTTGKRHSSDCFTVLARAPFPLLLEDAFPLLRFPQAPGKQVENLLLSPTGSNVCWLCVAFLSRLHRPQVTKVSLHNSFRERAWRLGWDKGESFMCQRSWRGQMPRQPRWWQQEKESSALISGKVAFFACFFFFPPKAVK